MINSDYKIIDDIKVFDSSTDIDSKDYNKNSLDKLYQQEEKHFWFISRKEFILKNMLEHIEYEANIIEVGAGTGNVSRFLQSAGYKNISVGEMYMNGLKYAKSYGINKCYQFNLLKVPFANEFDSVCLFDVLEHIENDLLVLENINQMLNDDGKVIITVPCHMWLWNRDDRLAGHKRRYNKKELISKLERSGFKILNSRYFFISITPFLLLRRILNNDTNKCGLEEYNGLNINKFINKILLIISRFENKINNYLPNFFGGSLIIVAKKSSK